MAERSVKVVVEAVVSGYVSKMREAEAATMSFAKRGATAMDEHANHIRTLSTSVGILGAGLAGLAGLAVGAAVSWETSWTDVTKTVSATKAQFGQLEIGLRGLAKTMPETHAQIAEVAAAAGQLGIATGSIVDFTRTMVMLGDSTNLSADEAATSIAQLMNVMQTAPEDVDNLGAALVALGNKGAGTERDILELAQRIASAGSIVGLSAANVLSLSNALASTGVNAEAGGTAISQTLIKISQSVSAGGKSLQDYADITGMTAEQFATAWKEKPAQAFDAFIEGLGRMGKAGKDVFGTLDTLHLSGIRTTTAILNLANGGDLLRKSLELGDAAWQKNTALVNEANKRYDTTAAKAKIAANVLRDDMISAGQDLLPIAGKIASEVTAMGDAFGSLPGPVKSSLGVLAGISGVSLLAAAGLLKVALMVVETRKAMAALELSAPRAGAALSGLGKAAGVATVALAVFEAASTFAPEAKTASTSKYTKAILELASGAKGAQSDLEGLFKVQGSGLAATDNLSDAIKALSANGLVRGLDKVGSIFGIFDSNASLAGKSVGNFDKALTSLVTSGATDQAATGFTYFANQAAKAGLSTKQAKDLLPAYSDALLDLKNAQEQAGKTTDNLGDSLKSMVPLTEEAQKALDKEKKATYTTAMGLFDMSKGIDSAKFSFQGWIKGLEDMAKAQAKWADNLILATNRGVRAGVVDELEKMGPAGAKALDDLAHGTDKDIQRVNDAFDTAASTATNLGEVLDGLPRDVLMEFRHAGDKDAISTAAKVAHQYHMTPAEVETILKALDYSTADIKAVQKLLRVLDGTTATPAIKLAGATAATAAARAVAKALNALDGKVANVTIRTAKDTYSVPSHSDPKPSLSDMLHPASGGFVSGPGGPRDDAIPAMLSNGEFVVNAAATKANIGLLHSINAQKFATGGPVGFDPVGLAGSFNTAIERWIKELQKAEEYDKKHGKEQYALDERTIKSLDKLGTKMSTLGDNMKSFSDSVSSNFLNDPFNKGGDNGNGTYTSNFDAYKLQVATDTAQAKQFASALKTAAARGLSGGLYKAVAASGDLSSAQGFAHSSRAEIAMDEKQWNARATAAASLGSQATSVAYGKQLTSLVQEITALRKKTELGSKTIDALSKQFAGAVTHGLSLAASSAQNRAVNTPKGR